LVVSRFRGLFGAVIAGSLIFSSTGVVAAAAAPTYQPDPWAVLSVMSGGASAVAVCGAAAAAATAQAPAGGCVLPQVDAPPPVAQNAPPQPIPVPPAEAIGSGGFGFSPILIGLVAIVAGVGAYFAFFHHGNGNSPS
jgi:hypothetical protein